MHSRFIEERALTERERWLRVACERWRGGGGGGGSFSDSILSLHSVADEQTARRMRLVRSESNANAKPTAASASDDTNDGNGGRARNSDVKGDGHTGTRHGAHERAQEEGACRVRGNVRLQVVPSTHGAVCARVVARASRPVGVGEVLCAECDGNAARAARRGQRRR